MNKKRRWGEGGEAPSLLEMLAYVRGEGWMVAVHNDYTLGGRFMTFWLFTHGDGRYLKGEGPSDVEALIPIWEQV